MGTVNLYRGLESDRQIFNFTGKLKDNLNLDWTHTEIIKNGEKLTPDYELKENEVLIIQETPGVATAMIILGVVALAVGIGTGIYAAEQAKKAKREMEEALKRIGKDNKKNEVASIPQLGDARNEKIDGKNVPIILGKHLFAPYFLSEPYMKPGGTDGEDLYWYGAFLVGQNGLCFEKLRNGTTDLATFDGNEPQRVNTKRFINPGTVDPPFYNADNYVDIVQKGNGQALNNFTDSVFEEKWSDSLDSSIEVGRKKLDNAKSGNVNNGVFTADENGIFIDDDGADPIIRETARFPMLAEIEISFPDGLYGWDSKNGVEAPADVSIKLEWSKNGTGGWQDIPVSFPIGNSRPVTQTISAGKNVTEWVNEMISGNPDNGRTLSYTMTLPNGGKYGDKDLSYILFEKESKEVATSSYNIYRRATFVFSDTKTKKKVVETSGGGTKAIGGDVTVYGAVSNGMLSRAKSKQMRFVFTADFTPYASTIYSKAGDPLFIRATRLTRMHTGSYRDRVYLTAIRTKQYNPNTSNASQLIAAKNINERYKDKFCRMGIKLKVNKNTQEFMDRFNVVVSMTGRTALGGIDALTGLWKWNNQWSTVKTKTSNSAAVLLELITGLIHNPSKHKDTEVDLKTFGKLYEYCMNRKVTIEGQGVQKFTLECNGVLTSGTRKIDAIQSILATCDAGLYVNEYGKLEVYFEDTQLTPIALLNPQRIVSMVDQRSLDRKADGYNVEFVDQEADWTQKTHRILRPRITVNEGLNTYSPMKLDFTTSYNQAMWHARRLLAKEEFRPGEIKCTVGKEGRYYKPGSLIKVQHERFKIGLGSGEITQLIRNGNQITGLKLMERFDISKERDYWIEYYVVDEDRNFVVQKQIQSVGEYTDRLMFTVPINLDDEDDARNIPVFGNILSTLYAEGLNTGRVWESKRYIVTDLSENAVGYDLALAEYHEEIYKDSEIEKIRERQSSILSAPPVVYEDQQRNEQQLLLDALREMTNPQNVDRIATQVFDREFDDNIEEAVGTIAPRFRGVYPDVTSINTAVTNKVFNLNDYIYYSGTTNQPWEEYYIYRWNGEGWDKIPQPNDGAEYGWMYISAANSIGAGKPSSAFSNVFCQALTAATAFIDSLFTKWITILPNGGIRSNTLINGERTFEVDGDTGILKAVRGTFKNITGTDMNIQGGTINIGPLFVSDDQTTPSQTRTYPTNTLISTFVNGFLHGNPSSGAPSVSTTVVIYYGGTLSRAGNTWQLYSINIIKRWVDESGLTESGGFVGVETSIEFNTSGGVKKITARSDAQIGYSVVINGGGSGNTFKLTGLPSQDPHEAGLLYAENLGNGVFISKG